MVLAGAVWLVARNADELRQAVHELGFATLAVSFVLAVLGNVVTSQLWLTLLRGLEVPVAWLEGAGVFFVTQLGKYIPGSVWPVMAQMELGRRWGAPRRTMLSANMLMLALVTATGLFTGASLLPWSSSGGLDDYWWTLLFLLPVIAALHPRTIPAVIDRVLALVGHEPLGIRVTNRSMLVAVIWGFVSWVLLGLHLFVMTHALGASGITGLAAAVGGIGLAWAVGLIFIPAPAGAGVREAVLVATFAPQIGTAPALAVALASRVILVLADVLLACLGVVTRPAR